MITGSVLKITGLRRRCFGIRGVVVEAAAIKAQYGIYEDPTQR